MTFQFIKNSQLLFQNIICFGGMWYIRWGIRRFSSFKTLYVSVELADKLAKYAREKFQNIICFGGIKILGENYNGNYMFQNIICFGGILIQNGPEYGVHSFKTLYVSVESRVTLFPILCPNVSKHYMFRWNRYSVIIAL